MKHPEYRLQKSVCQYLNYQYPDVLFLSDTVASVKLSIPQQVRNKAIQKSGFKCPDLIVLEPKGEYSGLFIELKTETPFKKDGEIKSNEHLKGQYETIEKLNNKGFKAMFVWSFEQAKEEIDNYLK